MDVDAGEQIEELYFCGHCSERLLSEWKGWPLRDEVPVLPLFDERGCRICGGKIGNRLPTSPGSIGRGSRRPCRLCLLLTITWCAVTRSPR
jgi:hypothetical protein